jgi:hypothetical protein
MGKNPPRAQREPLGFAPLNCPLHEQGELRTRTCPVHPGRRRRACPERSLGELSRTGTVAPYPERSGNAPTLPACPAFPEPRRKLSTPRGTKGQPPRVSEGSKSKPPASLLWPKEAGACNRNTCRLVWQHPTRYLGREGHFRGNENKPLTAISNRNSNDSRKLATLSESTTSNFLIATKMHISEEKAKREEKAKLILTGDAHKPRMCASATARLASEHSRGTLSGRCNVTPDFSVDFAGTGRASICPCRTGSN